MADVPAPPTAATGTTTTTTTTSKSDSVACASAVTSENVHPESSQIQSSSRPSSFDSDRLPNTRTLDGNKHDDNDDGDTSHTHQENAPLNQDYLRKNHSSSKLPAYRFADLQSGSPTVSPPFLAQRGPSPVSPNPIGDAHQTSRHHDPSDAQMTADYPTENTPPSPSTESPQYHSPRSRASTFQTASTEPTPIELGLEQDHPAPTPRYSSSTAASTHRRGAYSSYGSNSGLDIEADSPSSLQDRRRSQALEAIQNAVALTDKANRDRANRPRELLLPKRLSETSPPNERRESTSHRPPVSYKAPPSNGNTQPSPTTPVRVPPIRGFRSSGSRKSLVLDMNFQGRGFDFGDDNGDSGYDHTLRALEGRHGQDTMQITPPLSGGNDGADIDDSGDVFLKIAREESARRAADEYLPDETQSTVSRVRSSHRRPLSTHVATYQPASPPRLSRRLSDQQETSRSRRYGDDGGSEVSRVSAYRSLAREKASSTHPGEEHSRSRPPVALRPSPLTPRSQAYHDPGPDWPLHTRRRSSVTDNNTTVGGRTPYKSSTASYSQNKSYNSSPLVKSFDFQSKYGADGGHGVDGTESTLSTNAPSTVWDELDEIRSRINRLELTGKLPSTSGAAVSRLSDERPTTATTTVTTMSSSPKRITAGAPATEVGSATSSQREGHPLLHSALTRSKPLLSPEVFKALENAANDAMALSSMMGQSGHPGPISSGASTIGSGTTVTDRQLRRKTDSVCRSLTELCVALGENATQPKATPQQATEVPNSVSAEGPTTPTVTNSFTGMASQRRPSAGAEQMAPRPKTSPRPLSKYEERRTTLLNGSSLPSPRPVTGSTPATPGEATTSRRSSLLLSRTRRAGTEEPDDGRRSSLVLRNRRAGTEEPDEGRKTSFLVRNRRGTEDEGEGETRQRPPSRTNTEVSTTRPVARDFGAQPQAVQPPEISSPAASALPRRRLSTINTSRLPPPPSTSTSTPVRRYLERSTPDRETVASDVKPVDDRPQRNFSSNHKSLLGRVGSLSLRRQNRDSLGGANAAAGAR